MSLPEKHWFLCSHLEKGSRSGTAQSPLPEFDTDGFGSDAAFLASLGDPFGQPATVKESADSKKYAEASRMSMGLNLSLFLLYILCF